VTLTFSAAAALPAAPVTFSLRRDDADFNREDIALLLPKYADTDCRTANGRCDRNSRIAGSRCSVMLDRGI
jgi:hypothetical protein